MRINTNIAALNAQRQLGITEGRVADSMAKLSSGFRINRAADDAAGLGIANKLRADIRSMTQASRNAEQANSLLQISEGSTSGIQTMLERMKELATQANSDTVDDAGRQRINAEFTALRSEIARTVSTTKFQGKTLLDGTFGVGGSVTAGSDLASVTINGTAVKDDYTVDFSTAGKLTLTGGDSVAHTVDVADGAKSVNFDDLGITVTLAADYDSGGTFGTDNTISVAQGSGGGSFMIGSSGAYATDDVLSLTAINLQTGASGLNIDGLDLTTTANAQTVLDRVDTAIGSVNSALGTIGAFQNRIENARANLNTAIQNYSASESVIRDLDMASEMTSFSKSQILSQAGTAMLAQANQSAQGILQLLRG